MTPTRLRVAFVHPDLGIGGAERLVVDAALGLQSLGHTITLHTSHHDPTHAFDETRDGTLTVHHVPPPFPRSVRGKLHVLCAHARQVHLVWSQFVWGGDGDGDGADVFVVDQVSTCVPMLRATGKRVLFYCHFPDKLLAPGAFVPLGNEATAGRDVGLLRRIYRYPMDWLEEVTTRQADTLVANSHFTARIARAHFSSITTTPRVVYPGIHVEAYRAPVDQSAPDVVQITSQRPTLLSLNRFEKKKNAALAIDAFARLCDRASMKHVTCTMRLVIAGGYDPRLRDNIHTLNALVDRARSSKLTFNVLAPPHAPPAPPFADTTPTDPDVLFLLNFTTAQRSALLQSDATRALLYTPTNEHFGIGPVEGMVCGLPVLACDSGGPTESVVDHPPEQRTGWLRPPDPDVWADALEEICSMDASARAALSRRAQERAETMFGMGSMARSLEALLMETVAMGPVETWSVKGVGCVLAFVVGLVLAVLSRR